MSEIKNKSKEITSNIYFVTFEDYLKPKKPHKQRKLQLFHGSHIKKETQCQLQLNHLALSQRNTTDTQLQIQIQNNLKNALVHKINNDESVGKSNITQIKSLNSKAAEPIFQRLKQFLHPPLQADGTCRRKSGFEIYYELASIHGFINFINANLWQRLFWALVICFAICMCCIIVTMSHFMNQRNPIVFYTEGIAYPAWAVPLPAVTICNLNRISKFEAEKVAKKFLNKTSKSQIEILQLFPLALYASHEMNYAERDFLALEKLLKINNYTIEKLVYEISPKCDGEEYRFCRKMGHFEQCMRLVNEVLTVAGVCCTNNFLALKDTPPGQELSYSTSAGYETGLTLLLDPNVGNYTFSAHKFQGYKLFLHDSYEGIDDLSSKHYVLARTETFIGVTPSSAYGTRYLRSQDVKTRACYFPDERKLVTFQRYSQTNCLIECRSQLMYEKCGCLPTFWPKLNEKWNYCQSAKEVMCFLENKTISSQMLIHNHRGFQIQRNRVNYDPICGCLPSCDENKYSCVVESATLDRNFTLLQKRFFKGVQKMGKLILLHIFYEDLISARYRLDVSENWLSFMGTFGGIAGLYMGFSLVSGFEMIFFAIIRPACNWLNFSVFECRLILADARKMPTKRLTPNNRIFHLHRQSISIDISPPVHGGQPLQTRKSSRLSQIRELADFRNVRDWFMVNLKNYCKTTSLHGFNHITQKSNTKAERWFWIAVVIISIITSIVLVIVSYLWNRQTPTVTVIESSHFPTWNIPFPAVTICNFNKISKTKAKELAKTLKHPSHISDDDLEHFFRISMYFSFSRDITDFNLTLYEQIMEANNLTLARLTELLAPDCLETVSRCLWKGTNARCDSLFQRINTIEGPCCSFNYFGKTTNNFPVKIAYQVPKRPYRVTGCGYPTGLSLLLNPITSDYFGTFFSSYGFRLLIHDSFDFPDENAETKVITSTRESYVRINPESTYATGYVRRMDLALRDCLFADERRLRIMQRYSFINCMTECRIKILLERCGCIPPNMPNNGSYPLCDLRQTACIVANREVFTRAFPELNNTISIIKATESFPCGCLPDCEANSYPSEITMGRLNVKMNFNKIKSNDSSHNDDNILLHIFFSDLLSTRYRREIFQNWLSALASFGGLLGLIMGFSIVTAFEFIYFLTFRPVFNYFNQ